VVAVAGLTAIAVLGLGTVQSATGSPPPPPGGSCQFANGIKHVISIQFDNTHFLRDNANVPSDLEQMPHLLNFIRGNGTLLTNDHTVLISHTATGILSTLTGVYPDRMGQPVSNSFRYSRRTPPRPHARVCRSHTGRAAVTRRTAVPAAAAERPHARDDQ
jgi:hypothetical protein